MRKSLIALLILTMLFVVTACNPEQEASVPEGTAINTLDELKTAVVTEGKYYLANDIEIEGFIDITAPITLDGNGKTIKVKYTQIAERNNGLVVKTSGITIKNVKFESVNGGLRNSAMIAVFGNGTADKPVVIDSCSFDSKKELSDATLGESAIIVDYTGGNYLTVKNCKIKNVKYGMYFNHISNATVSNNTIDGTLYNGIIVAADSSEYRCSNVTIEKNTLQNISSANYDNDLYSSGIVVGQYSSDVEIKSDNSITMLNDKKPTYIVSSGS